MDETPVVATITVIDSGPGGVAALFDGTPRSFPDLQALFTAAVHLPDLTSAADAMPFLASPERSTA